jgi:nuclear protein localization family protein 4
MVDHLEFASHDLVDRFIQAWRSTGNQRLGFMIGHYEPYEKVPMGIKAVVEAIHEPLQEGEVDGLVVPLPWEEEPRIVELSRHCSPPLHVVGQIFTDLTPTEEDKTKQLYKRHPQSFFMSSLEVILAASMQTSHPTVSRASPTGQFGSRFVTAIVSGAKEGVVDISAFQVSEQACAMVAADMIEATIVPGAMRVKQESREPGNSRYVPEVFYRERNEYGLDVKHSAKPTFPVEYLLVNVSGAELEIGRATNNLDRYHTAFQTKKARCSVRLDHSQLRTESDWNIKPSRWFWMR